jgi:hypothetical protein
MSDEYIKLLEAQNELLKVELALLEMELEDANSNLNMTTMTINDLVSVQPMTAPSNTVWSVNYKVNI